MQISENNSIDTDRLNKLKDKVNKMIQQIEEYKNLPKVLIIGNYESGKSTILKLLTNPELPIDFGQYSDFSIDFKLPSMVVDPQHHFVLCESHLYSEYPFYNPNDMFYNTENEIINSLFIEYLLKNEKQLKILAVASEREFSGRRYGAMSLFEIIHRTFLIRKQLQKGLGIVLTKTKRYNEKLRYIDAIKHTILSLQHGDYVDYSTFKWTKPQLMAMDLCDFFKENPDYIFVLPKASKKNAGQKYDFDDRQRLECFLQKDFISNPIYKVSLSEEAMAILKKLDKVSQKTSSDQKKQIRKMIVFYSNKFE